MRLPRGYRSARRPIKTTPRIVALANKIANLFERIDLRFGDFHQLLIALNLDYRRRGVMSDLIDAQHDGSLLLGNAESAALTELDTLPKSYSICDTDTTSDGVYRHQNRYYYNHYSYPH